MFKNYLNLKKKFSIRNSRVYKFKNEPLLCYIMAITSYWVSPIFFILKIKPNSITALNFFIALTSIILILIGDVIYFLLERDLRRNYADNVVILC